MCRFVPAPSELAAMDEGAQGALSVLTYRVRSLAGGRRPALRSQKIWLNYFSLFLYKNV